MKFRHRPTDTGVHLELAGDLASADCNCLQAFWDCHIDAETAAVEIDMTAVDDLDAESVAVLTTLVRAHLQTGAEVTIHRPPQMLAHTLYKIGLLDHSGLTLIDPRSDEQHAT